MIFLLFPFMGNGQCDDVTSVNATSITASSVQISFTTPSVSIFFVIVYTDGATTWRQNVNDPGSPYPHLVTAGLSGLSQSTEYDFYVVRYCGVSDSSETAVESFTTLAGQCDTVTNIVTTTTNSTATITSSEATYGTSYRIAYIRQGQTDTIRKTQSTADFYLTGLKPAATYYYRVTTICGADSVRNSFRTFATKTSPAYTPLATYGAQSNRLLAMRVLNFPANNGEPSLPFDGKNDYPSIIMDTTNSEQYFFNPRTQSYFKVGIDVVAGIPELKAHKLTPNRIFVKDSIRGGNFTLIQNNDIAEDGGVYFNADSIGAGWFWKRETADTRAVNLRWFGALGRGVQSYIEDSTALWRAITYIGRKGGGALYVPKTDSFYAFRGRGIFLPDNIEIFGDGPGSEIKHIDPANVEYYRGVIFYTSLYGPDSAHSIFRCPKYYIQDAFIGQQFLILSDEDDAENLPVGKVIALGGREFYKNDDPLHKRYGQFEANEVLRVNEDTVFLKFALTTNLISDTASPKIVDVNSGTVLNPNFGDVERWSHNISIHDLRLTQADFNMVTGEFYTNFKTPASTIQGGCTFESRYYNLDLTNFIPFGGNGLNRCDIYGLRINASRKLFDCGFGSANTKFHDIQWTYNDNAFDTVVSVAMMYINEGSHDMDFYNIKASGNWGGTSLIQFSGGSYNINLTNMIFNMPNYRNNDKNAFLLTDDTDSIYVHDINISDITIRVDSIGRWIDFNGNNGAPLNRNFKMSNVRFFGNVNNDLVSIDMRNMGNMYIRHLYAQTGDTVEITNCEGIIIDNLISENAYFNVESTSIGNYYNITTAGGNRTGLSTTNKSNAVVTAARAIYGINAGGSSGIGVSAFGYNSLPNNTGEYNTGLGYNVLEANTTGERNVSIGANTMTANTTGNNNVAIGNQALISNISGARSVVIGYQSGQNLTTSLNTIIGASAGNNLNAEAGQRNIVIGATVSAPHYNSTASINIANTIYGADASGADSTISTNGRIGIGVRDPLAFLHVRAGGATYPSLQIDSSATDVSSPADGQARYVNGRLRMSLRGTSRNFTTDDGTETLTNKTISGLTNTITDIGPVSASVSGSNVTTTSATAADITGLSISVAANKTYRITGALFIGSSNTGGSQYTFTGPAGAAILSCVMQGSGSGANTTQSVKMPTLGTLTTTGLAFLRANNTAGSLTFIAYITTAGTAGTLQMQFASAVAGETSTVFVGSTIDAIELQ